MLSVGIVLVPDFTMIAFAALADTLRLAADDGDRSRPIRCRWHVMSSDGRLVTASNGVGVAPASRFVDPAQFDYLAVVGGTLHRDHDATPIHDYLRRAAAVGVPLIGVCTGGVHLARAGLMSGRRMCISWLHHADVAAEFPDVRVVADELYVWDCQRATCAGGTSVIHLASELIDRHLGTGASDKGLRLLQEDKRRDGAGPQAPPTLSLSSAIVDARVRRAVLMMESATAGRIAPASIAAASGLSVRQLNRLFASETGMAMAAYARRLRLERADRLVRKGRLSLTAIAAECGFADSAHFSKSYRSQFGIPPSGMREPFERRTDVKAVEV